MSKKDSEKIVHKEPALVNAAKLLMLIPFIYSGVFYTGTVLMLISNGSFEAPRRVSAALSAGTVLVSSGIATAFFRRYYLSFIQAAAGAFVHFRGAHHIVIMIRKKLDTHSVGADLVLMDREYMLHLYPLALTAVIALGLAVWAMVVQIKEYRQDRHMRETAPVKSIIDDR